MRALRGEPGGDGPDRLKAGGRGPAPLGSGSRSLLVLAAMLIAALDFASKVYFAGLVRGAGGRIEVAPFLNLVEVYNTGAAFGILAGAQQYLGIFSLLLCIALYLAIHLHKGLRMELGWCLALLLGGGAGNAIDRLHKGRVFDFVDLHLAGWHWPAFNLADMALTAGALLLAWQALRPAPKKP
ncbi:MAG: signal peptidase II [Betaproteobacteria bacterium AqS2]|uniref:Lipoprotein signal peptidase n=1 Tax=Candidatus Amphirhobacter heronislandensis TaxID=1732024 RepID=A0A930UIE7_9GAMM|nr:signal peptidase II [Betaproteobacteria bacterium AqS2]